MKRMAWFGTLLLIMGCTMMGENGRVAHDSPSPGRPEPAPEEVWFIDEGLLAGQDDAPRGGRLETGDGKPIPLKHTDVRAEIAMYLGAVTVTQQYHNPYDGKIEAVYTFPLPQNSAVREFVMKIGERQIRGIVREREEAEKLYAEARRQGHVASLMTQQRPNIFTQSVANIEPGKEIDIEVTYYHTLRYEDGTYEFRFPMTIGPRYKEETPVEYLEPTQLTSNDVSLAVEIDAGVSIESLESPSHDVFVERRGDSRAAVTLRGDRIPNRDFVLRYRVAGDRIKAALATHRDDTGGYFTLMIQPPASLAEIPAGPREMIFVVDCSGSMQGEPMATARRAMGGCLNRLRPEDTFQIIRFSNEAESNAERPLRATHENVERGKRYVQGLKADGGTEMLAGLRAAFDTPHEEGRYRIIALMTDGFIGNDLEVIGKVRGRDDDSRLFTFGIGTAPNDYLIERAAGVAHGASVYLGEGEVEKLDGFFQRVEHPALTDVEIDWGDMSVFDVYPRPLPDLLVGRPVILVGRFEGERPSTVRIRGKIAGEPHEMSLEFDPAAQSHDAIASVWARAKIAMLYDEMAYNGDHDELPAEIRNIALQHGLLSEFTAFIAVDASRKTEGDHGTTVPVPIPVPKGVKYENTRKP